MRKEIKVTEIDCCTPDAFARVASSATPGKCTPHLTYKLNQVDLESLKETKFRNLRQPVLVIFFLMFQLTFLGNLRIQKMFGKTTQSSRNAV